MLEERFQNCLISVMSNDHDQVEDNFSVLATTDTTPSSIMAQPLNSVDRHVFRQRSNEDKIEKEIPWK